jgi:hypothetical protein
MFVNTDQIQMGVTNFMENELGKKATGVNKFFVYMAMPLVNKKVSQYLNDFSSNALTKDFFDENNNVDIDKIYNMAKTAIQKSGQFTYYGIIFNESDIDKLYTYIRG